ncbi:MAG TPA: hypothetical protein VIJ16_05755, partial [Gemmatimonadaceae bacterium]
MMRWSPPQQRTEGLIALSQLACVATLGALFTTSWHRFDGLLNGAFIVSLAVFALASIGIAAQTQRLPRALFSVFATAAMLLVIAEIAALFMPASALNVAMHTVSSTDKAILVATLNALLPLYGHAMLVAQERAAEALESSVVQERTFSSTLEARVAVRTAELEDAQRVLQHMWRLGQQISFELDPTRVLERFVDAASDIAQADGAVIGLMHEDGSVRVPIARGALVELAGTQSSATGSVMGQVIRTGKRWAVADAAAQPTPPSLPDGMLTQGEARSVA